MLVLLELHPKPNTNKEDAKGLHMKRSALESSQAVSGVKRERAGPTEHEIGAYLVAQAKCSRVAPSSDLV